MSRNFYVSGTETEGVDTIWALALSDALANVTLLSTTAVKSVLMHAIDARASSMVDKCA